MDRVLRTPLERDKESCPLIRTKDFCHTFEHLLERQYVRDFWRQAIRRIRVQVRAKLVRRDVEANDGCDLNRALRGHPASAEPLRDCRLADPLIPVTQPIDAVCEGLLTACGLDGPMKSVQIPASRNTMHGIKHHERCSVNNTSGVRTSPMAKPGERIKQAREEAGLTQAQLGDACGGWGQTRISAYETGRNEPSLRDFEAMAAVLRRSVPWLQGFEETSAAEPTQKYGGRAPILSDVPIIGFVIATPDTDGFFEDMGHPAGAGEAYVPWPTTDPNAYALRVRGDSMQPRMRPGEILVVEPNAQAQPGDDVVVRTKNGRKMVKQLLLRKAGSITLGSINQAHQQTTIPLEEIESVHLVGAIVPRNAYVKEE